MKLVSKVKNISAKHEGAEVEVDKKRQHPTDILDYFMAKKDIEQQKLMPAMQQNYLDKHNAVNNTAKALTENGLSFIAAPDLHNWR